MGYVKVIQYANTIEIYEYQKSYVPQIRRDYRKNTRRASAYRSPIDAHFTRTQKSIARARTSFIRLVKANLQAEKKPLFLTLTIERETSLAVGYKYLSNFFKNVSRFYGRPRYIGVPEWQQRGVLHFHFLVFDIAGKSLDVRKERSTRNIQRLWHKGFCDLRSTSYVSDGLAGYLAKYMSSALADERLGNRRAYTCSRNIYRPTIKSFNFPLPDADLTPVDSLLQQETQYDTIYLGRCHYKNLTNK